MNKKEYKAHQKKMNVYKLVGASVGAVFMIGAGISHHSAASQQVSQDKQAVATLQQGIKDAKAAKSKTSSQQKNDSSKNNVPSSSDQMKEATDFVTKYVQSLATINSTDVANTINKTYLSDKAQLRVSDNIANDKNSFAIFGDKTDDLTATASLPKNNKVTVLVTSASTDKVVFTAVYNTTSKKIDATSTYGLAK